MEKELIRLSSRFALLANLKRNEEVRAQITKEYRRLHARWVATKTQRRLRGL
jgi:hypothetical protein